MSEQKIPLLSGANQLGYGPGFKVDGNQKTFSASANGFGAVSAEIEFYGASDPSFAGEELLTILRPNGINYASLISKTIDSKHAYCRAKIINRVGFVSADVHGEASSGQGGGGDAGVAGQKTYTIAGTSISCWSHPPIYYPAAVVVNNNDGTATITQANIADNFRVGDFIRVAGETDLTLNQFYGQIVDFDRVLGNWIKYTTTGAYNLVSGGLKFYSPMLDGKKTNPHSVRGVWAWLRHLSSGSLQCVGNFAMASGVTSQTNAIFDKTHAIASPDFVFMDCPVNDIYNQGLTAEIQIEQIKIFISKCLEISATPVIHTIAPRADTTSQLSAHTRVNQWLMTEAAVLGAIIVDITMAANSAGTFTNPVSSTQAPTAGFLADSVHYDYLGAFAAAREVYKVIEHLLKPVPVKYTVKNAAMALTSKLLNKNPALLEGAASAVGVTGKKPPTNMSITLQASTGVLDLPAKTIANDGTTYGNRLKLDLTVTALDAQVFRIAYNDFDIAKLAGAKAVSGYIKATINGVSKGLVCNIRALYTNPGTGRNGFIRSHALSEGGGSNVAMTDTVPLDCIFDPVVLRQGADAGTLQFIAVEILSASTGAGAISFELHELVLWAI